MVLGLGNTDALARRSHKLSVAIKVRRTRRVVSETTKLFLDTDVEVMMSRLIRFDVHMRRRLPRVMTPYTGVGMKSCV
jgi:hypothetical protein